MIILDMKSNHWNQILRTLKEYKAPLFVYFIFIIFIAFPVLLQWSRYCFHAWDLGIYAQALSKISLFDLNPFIPIRDIRIFSDHLDPIIIPFALLHPPIDSSLYTIFIEFFFTSAAFLWFIKNYYTSKGISQSFVLFSFVYFVLGGPTFSALFYPSHPGVWAVFPLILLGIAVQAKNAKGILLTCLALLLFKEEYIFVNFFLALIIGFDKKLRKTAIAITIISLVWGFIYFNRSWLFDQNIYNHAKGVSVVFSDPFGTFVSIFKREKFHRTLLLILPFFGFFFFCVRKKIRLNYPMLGVFISLLGIRAVLNKHGFHYDIVLIASLIMIFPYKIVSSKLTKKEIKFATYFGYAVIFPLSIVRSVDVYSVTTYFRKYDRCPGIEKRTNQLNRAREVIQGMDPNIPVLAMGNLATKLIFHPRLYQLEVSISGFKPPFVAIWERKYGDPWPTSHEWIRIQIEKHRSSSQSKKIYCTEYVCVEEFKPRT